MRRGFVLIAVVLVSLVLFALGLGLMTKKGLQYRAASLAAEAAQARELALSGLEDARTKLDRDLAFPPIDSDDQETFSYTETVGSVGTYTVEIDLRYRPMPFGLLRLRSTGLTAHARHTVAAELDVSERLRSDPAQPNPRHFRFIQRQDLGSF